VAKLHFAVADLFAVWIPSLLVHVLTYPVAMARQMQADTWSVWMNTLSLTRSVRLVKLLVTGMTMELSEAEIFDYYHESHGALQCDLLNSENICIR